VTDEVFAASIGVKRSALKKYLLGASTPSLRTVALAKRHYNVSVPYGETELGGILRKSKETPRGPTLQLRLPFSLQIANREGFQVELKELNTMKYELRISTKSEKALRNTTKMHA